MAAWINVSKGEVIECSRGSSATTVMRTSYIEKWLLAHPDRHQNSRFSTKKTSQSLAENGLADFILGLARLFDFVTTGLAPVERCLKTRPWHRPNLPSDLQAAAGGLQVAGERSALSPILVSKRASAGASPGGG